VTNRRGQSDGRPAGSTVHPGVTNRRGQSGGHPAGPAVDPGGLNRLLLDEHFRPEIARALRERGFDVVAVSEDDALTGLPDDEIFAVAAATGRRVVTENGRDFRPLLAGVLARGDAIAPLLLTSSRRHPRHKANTPALVQALADWLDDDDRAKSWEDWLA